MYFRPHCTMIRWQFHLIFPWKSRQLAESLDGWQKRDFSSTPTLFASQLPHEFSTNCSLAFSLSPSPSLHLFPCSTIREGIIRCILATDMARHNEILTQFIEITPIFDYNNRAHINLVSAITPSPSSFPLSHSLVCLPAALHDTYQGGGHIERGTTHGCG